MPPPRHVDPRRHGEQARLESALAQVSKQIEDLGGAASENNEPRAAGASSPSRSPRQAASIGRGAAFARAHGAQVALSAATQKLTRNLDRTLASCTRMVDQLDQARAGQQAALESKRSDILEADRAAKAFVLQKKKRIDDQQQEYVEEMSRKGFPAVAANAIIAVLGPVVGLLRWLVLLLTWLTQLLASLVPRKRSPRRARRHGRRRVQAGSSATPLLPSASASAAVHGDRLPVAAVADAGSAASPSSLRTVPVAETYSSPTQGEAPQSPVSPQPG